MSRGRFIACAALASALAASCGGEKGSADEGPVAAEGAPAEGARPAKAPEAPPAEAKGREIAGKAIPATESGPGPESALALALGDGGRLGGELALGPSRCAIAGMVEEAVARAWLTCPAAGGASAKRGTLVGEEAGGAYSGTFAVSDDGAAEVIRGTWTAGK